MPPSHKLSSLKISTSESCSTVKKPWAHYVVEEGFVVHEKSAAVATPTGRGGMKISSGQSFEDEEIECRDCGNNFTFTAGEQEFYNTKGWENKPVRGQCLCPRDNVPILALYARFYLLDTSEKPYGCCMHVQARCKECQAAKKARFGEESPAGRGGRGGGRGGRDGGRGRGGRGGDAGGGGGCFKCGEAGHFSRECPTGGGGSGPCFSFKNNGNCKFGDTCKFSHS
eukprot:1192089-Prorocentrum_minimum.AAC.2